MAIIGEALNYARRADLTLALEFDELSSWVALRNIVIHVYDGIDHDLIWTTATAEIPGPIEKLETLLAARRDEDES